MRYGDRTAVSGRPTPLPIDPCVLVLPHNGLLAVPKKLTMGPSLW